MKNFVQISDPLTLAAPYAVSAGGGALIGSLFGVAAKTLANAEVGVFNTEGVFSINKLSTAVFAEGAIVYWNNTAKECTAVTTGNFPIGIAISAAGSGALTVDVRLDGTRTAAAA